MNLSHAIYILLRVYFLNFCYAIGQIYGTVQYKKKTMKKLTKLVTLYIFSKIRLCTT